MPSVRDEALIAEQIDYYRQRAPEYDVTSFPPDDRFAPYGRELAAALDRFAPTGSVLEIASGTGAWTRQLVRHAGSVTALDASPEMHEVSKRRLGSDDRVRYVEADVFAWRPDGTYDVAFFANWLSHVPPARFDQFWETVRTALSPTGRVFFVDELEDAWRQDDLLREEHADDLSVPVVRRRLLDGRSYRVIKMFWDPDELTSRLGGLRWEVAVHSTGPFYWAEGRPLPR